MPLDATVRRRLFGALVLALALGMLIAGETVLPGRLGPMGFGIYWLICLLLTATAVVVAFRDLHAIQRRNLQEQRDLFHATLEEIVTEAKNRLPQQDKHPQSGTTGKSGEANPPRG